MSRKKLLWSVTLVLIVLLGTLASDGLLPVLVSTPVKASVTTLLDILVGAVPFLLLGCILSGLMAVFVTPDELARVTPRNHLLATLAGALLGLIFPVGEYGVVPLVRRLYRKGLPVSAGVAFLLGAPALNPLAIATTYVAFGLGTVFWARLGSTLLIATAIGLLFRTQPNLVRVLQPQALAPLMGGSTDPIRLGDARAQSFPCRLQRALGIAGGDFLDMGRYLMLGALIAAALQTAVPQPWLINASAGPAASVATLALLAFVQSAGSTVDASLALPLANTFTGGAGGAVIAFLVLGPMVDIKSALMFLGVFRRRVVFYLVLLPFLCAVAIGLIMNFRF